MKAAGAQARYFQIQKALTSHGFDGGAHPVCVALRQLLQLIQNALRHPERVAVALALELGCISKRKADVRCETRKAFTLLQARERALQFLQHGFEVGDHLIEDAANEWFQRCRNQVSIDKFSGPWKRLAHAQTLDPGVQMGP